MYRIWRITAIGETHRVLSACLLGHPTYLWVVVLIILVFYITKHLFLPDHWVDVLNEHCGPVE